MITGVTALHPHGVEIGAAETFRLNRATPTQLIAAAAEAVGRGCRLARRAALARAEVDSPKETEVRLVLVLAGLPEPRCNPRIGYDREPIGRMDLVLDPYRLIVEYDGEQHRTDPWQWSRDIARHEAAVNAGYLVIRITAGRLFHHREIARTVYARRADRGYTGPPPTFSPEWRAMFESRRPLWRTRAGSAPQSPETSQSASRGILIRRLMAVLGLPTVSLSLDLSVLYLALPRPGADLVRARRSSSG